MLASCLTLTYLQEDGNSRVIDTKETRRAAGSAQIEGHVRARCDPDEGREAIRGPGAAIDLVEADLGRQPATAGWGGRRSGRGRVGEGGHGRLACAKGEKR